MNIRARAVLYTAFIFTAVILAFITLAFGYLADARKEEMNYRAKELAELVSVTFEIPLLEKNHTIIRDMTDRFVAHEDLTYLTIDQGDSLIAHSRSLDTPKDGITVVIKEVEGDEGRLGTVIVGYRNHYSDNMASPIGQMLIWGTSGIGLFAIVVIYILLYSITRPLRKLHQIKKNGEPTSRFSLFDVDEIETTVNEVNQLRKKMDRSYNKLQSSLRDHEFFHQQTRILEERSQAIYHASLDAIVVVDDQDTIIEFNPMAEQLFGWSRDEILGLRLAETIIPERLRESHIIGMQHLIKTGEGPVLDQRIELPAMRKSGREFTIEISISSAKTKNGYIFVSYIRDISLQKAREEERQQTVQAFEMGFPMLIADAKGHIVRINQAFSDMLGYKPENVIGEKPRSLTENPTDKPFHTRIWLSLLGRGFWHGELELRHKTGHVIRVKSKMKSQRNESDEMQFYVAHFEVQGDCHQEVKPETYLEDEKQSPR
ncbi:PAS domain S-box protein [Grimontia kaedaensis]|uniref:PAS domain S-box protein n=1 Tax=Grimontia kaedaensis TaxID=2872157 RepID=A0ABY4WU19_9GAMM|nr:PAS domain S-box protein [Grimontia kaedaensis]USH01395.1 PAS domain S-box protein [Grimontia kaedaensis]